ncbi:ABC transporter ATP-binding protein [Agromyces sp. Soil535]|uniref:ABC transporter ATP-binding protein n=1 Tax=Agromyces sp. Soil535 TaxID=1736390 RepID=UPI000B2672FE|nr:ABC transporter ATP-binding protein [Agromyces sp. Soil535]
MNSVSAGYGGGLVLRDVSLTVEAGRATCIVGPNGAGKSTMLKVICDDLRPVSGTIEIDGEQVTGIGPAAAIRRGVVMIPQTNALFPGMTVRENILLGGHAIRIRGRAARQRFDELAVMFPIIRERASAHAGLLSGGQRRMVEFARALMSRPRVVLLDEPSIGLDPKSRETLAGSVRALVEAGTTVVLVEQNVRFGLSLAATGVIMESGRFVASGPADRLLDDPGLRAVFLGGHAASTTEEH